MARTLIINADDLGYDPAVTRGILEAMDVGVVTSTTFMVNTPHSEDAARAGRGRALGLHFNLARWAPVSKHVSSTLLAHGEWAEALVAKVPVEVAEAEALAQLDRLQALTGREATHVDVHKHLHTHPNVLEGLARAARARALPVRSIDPGMRKRLRELGVATNDHFLGGAGATAYWTLAQLEAELSALQDGVTELMCHPGYAPTTVKSGYSAQREVELATFKDPRARALLSGAQATLATFATAGLST
jgi:predicted glycoside hydrolase/deacetylase ChbG (UPF0249 family)